MSKIIQSKLKILMNLCNWAKRKKFNYFYNWSKL